MVVDLLYGAFATSEACLELSQHRRFVGCEVHSDCSVASTEALVGTYTRQVLTGKSDVSVTDEVVVSCKMVVRALEVLRARKRMGSWKVPAELDLTQMFPSQMRPSFRICS